VVGVVVGAVAGIVNATAPGSTSAVLTLLLFFLWAGACVVVLSWLFWRWVTYRVGVRLFISYLLIGVSPFVFSLLFGGIALYMLMGQYTSVRSGDLLDLELAEIRGLCRSLIETDRRDGADAALERLREIDAAPVTDLPEVTWMARLGGRIEFRSDRAAGLPEPSWIGPGTTEIPVRSGDMAWAMVAESDSESNHRIVALVPLTSATGRAIEKDAFFQMSFVLSVGGGSDDVGVVAAADDEGITVRFTDQDADSLWGPWQPAGEGLWHRPWVVWFRRTSGLRDLETGSTAGVPAVVSLLRTSPAGVWNDFVLSRYTLSTGLQAALFGVAAFCLVVYGLALTVAASMIVSITRSAARLSRGARAVERGNLDYRIRVRRHDQLGDLAASFNSMSESVQDMIGQVADRERLAHELELAREIQESLLPDRHMRHGPLTVHATFRPATEVGGDYFDIFPLSADRLVVVVGDVAGHGLHTGLLMASLKSAVAALMHEGYTGSELIGRVNRLIVGQSASRTMATLGVFEIDPHRGTLTVASAGHPPAYLLRGGRCEELLAGSLPLGSSRCAPRTLDRPFDADSSLVVYSDGLVEALDQGGEPFGYQRLADLLAGSTTLGGGEIVAALLRALDRHLSGGELGDDLTLLVVDGGGNRSSGASSAGAVPHQDASQEHR